MTTNDFVELRRFLTEEPARCRTAWLEAYERSSLRLPGAVDRHALAPRIFPLLDLLLELIEGDASPGGRFVPGSNGARELEKSLAFVAASLGGEGVSAFDVSALIFAMGSALSPHLSPSERGEMDRFVTWLAVLAADSLAAARERAALERARAELEESTPVVVLAPGIAAAFFVGRPDEGIAASVFSRLLFAAVRCGAQSVIVDVGGLAEDTEDVFLHALSVLCQNSHVSARIGVFVVQAAQDLQLELSEERFGTRIICFDCFEDAFARALEESGMRVVRSPGG